MLQQHEHSKQFATYVSALRKAGLRVTDQRSKICRYLAETDRHPTPYQVFAALQEQYPNISRATVYNTLNTLQGLGAIVEINFGADHTHYDTNPEPHINLICLRCHAIEDCHVTLEGDSALQRTIAHYGFQPLATKVDVLGLCKNCQEATTTDLAAYKEPATDNPEDAS
ncbi:MAG: Fur family transcriptional regulator [Caldilineaceae bacterium]